MDIAIDFDGTIVKHEFPRMGDVLPKAFEWMKKFEDAGARLLLNTMRSDEYLNAAVECCRENGIEFFGVNHNPEQDSWTSSPKVYAQLYIDDAAFGCPLVHEAGSRPYVDWDIVGPAVFDMLNNGY